MKAKDVAKSIDEELEAVAKKHEHIANFMQTKIVLDACEKIIVEGRREHKTAEDIIIALEKSIDKQRETCEEGEQIFEDIRRRAEEDAVILKPTGKSKVLKERFVTFIKAHLESYELGKLEAVEILQSMHTDMLCEITKENMRKGNGE